jgi:16S rRNA (uracil1498-N3)-methyltransferase
MDTPYFHHPRLPEAGSIVELTEDTARHVVSVLRMQEGEPIILVDGHGSLGHAVILHVGKKKCSVRIASVEMHPDDRPPVSIAVSPVKNAARYEWMVEKLAEIGIRRIIPLLTERTVRERMRADRLQSITISAMLQSQQAWMTEVSAPSSLAELLKEGDFTRRYIAHCLPDTRSPLRNEARSSSPVLMLIGPEGDFTPAEIQEALNARFVPVSLGENRLRTETAAVVAAVLLAV